MLSNPGLRNMFIFLGINSTEYNRKYTTHGGIRQGTRRNRLSNESIPRYKLGFYTGLSSAYFKMNDNLKQELHNNVVYKKIG